MTFVSARYSIFTILKTNSTVCTTLPTSVPLFDTLVTNTPSTFVK